MLKAYEDFPPITSVYDATHLQDSAAQFASFMAGHDYLQDTPEEIAYVDDFAVRAKKYARARYAMGLRAEDYDAA